MAGKITDMTKQDPYETTSSNAPGQVVGYARVSSASQNLDRQLEALRTAGCQRIFQEKVSGSTKDREQLEAALTYLREGDLLICTSMDRLARSLPDLYGIVEELTSKGIKVRFLKEGQEYAQDSDSVSRLMLGILGSVAAFERALIRERQAEGIAQARKRGVYRGRKKKLDSDDLRTMMERINAGVPKSKVARELGISRATLYRYESGQEIRG